MTAQDPDQELDEPSSLLARMKRRKLFQWAIAYAGGAWLILQLLSLLAQPFAWPALVMRAAVVLLAVGFVAAMVLAWFHGEKGEQRAGGVELLMLAGILVIAGVAVAWVRGDAQPGVVPSTSAFPASLAVGAGSTSLAAAQNSIAVLPFVNMSSDPEQEFFSEGLTEELLNALAQLPELRVAARTSSFSFQGKDVAIDSIARFLRVAHVLEGSVRKDGGRIRVTAQLIRAQDGYHVWSETYDRELKGVFAIQDEISRAIVEALQLKLGAGQTNAPLVHAGTEDAEAYSLYLQGRHHWSKRTEPGFRKAIELYERAIARDPGYARAYSGLADAYLNLGNFAIVAPAEAYPRAEAMARKALALDSTLAEAHTSLAATALWHTNDWALAEREFRRALKLNPNDALSRYWYSAWLSYMGRTAEAIREVEHAHRLDPLALQIGIGVGFAYYHARQYDRAIQAYRRTLAIDPGFANGYFDLSRALMNTGRFEEAAQELRRAAELDGTDLAVYFATLYARWDKEEEARRFLARAMTPGRPGYLQPTEVAITYAALGEPDEAIRWLRRGMVEGAPYLGSLKTDPAYDPLRAEPGFQALLRQLNLDR